MPLPFTREIFLTSPPLEGNDVLIATTLLTRDPSVPASFVSTNTFTSSCEVATELFQSYYNLSVSGVIDNSTASLLLSLHSADGYKDNGFTAASLGYMYKIHIPVYSNRSIETSATLYNANNEILLVYPVRTHGARDDGTFQGSPDFGDGDVGLNEFTTNGNTVTGLIEIDLNSPEPYPDEFGPWPINRLVRGLEGNALLLLPNIRDGLLIHTGNWSTESQRWTPLDAMPNSDGCVHAHPSDVYETYKILVNLGVEVRANPFSGKNYPYVPQGIAVIELID